jgi:tetratricopeptide (TPR) repeat protein
MIVRNCAQPLAATLACVRPIADEIVVLDTGSTDDTLVVASQAGAAVHKRAWDDDFAAARNACLEKVTGDWVLWLDAGETLDETHARDLRELVRTAADPQRAYMLNIALPAAAGQIGSEQIARFRLHPRHAGLCFTGRVRERIDTSLAGQNMQTAALPYVIQRGPSEHDPAVKAGKAQRNIRLADLALAELGPTAELHNVLGEAFQSLGDGVRAAQHYRRTLDLAQRGGSEQLEAFYGLLTCLDGVSADRSDQLSLCMLALEHFPLDAQLLVALGGYLQSLEQGPLAIRSFDLAFRHGQIETQIWHLPEIREIAAACAATAWIATGEQEQAQSLLAAAVRTFPGSQRLALQLIDLLVNRRLRDEALAIVGELALPADRQRLAAAVRGACLAQAGDWTAAVDLLQAAMLDGCQARFCFRWLVAGWLALERPREAQSALRAWQAVDANQPEIADLADQANEQLSRSVRVDSADHASGQRRRPSVATERT